MELVINLIHPNLACDGLTFEIKEDAFDKETAEYSYNSLLTIISMLRVYHMTKSLILMSKFMGTRAQRVCQG